MEYIQISKDIIKLCKKLEFLTNELEEKNKTLNTIVKFNPEDLPPAGVKFSRISLSNKQWQISLRNSI